MRRLDDWKSRLSAYVLACGTRTLEFGVFDCSLFGADGVEAVTGVDIAADFRGRYTTFKGGLRVVRKAGFADHLAVFDHFLGPRIRWMAATAGDLAAVTGEDGSPAVGIVQGANIYVLAPAGGLTLAPLDAALMAWRVGDV
ncbi:hypothetical protein D2T29_22065 [Sinirhodobacter populi]|uniref:DUF6950 domain-containing protein n=1 Tax=Paenirhodobacter populi TaxID=2306993 RepID=A0A443JY21_9RHOB|nr:hypothetical protein [Sinirhodobacter populi]RWR25420.1 hypothetical protein D2T29_22065 [Sinirhodobacter populi]